MELVTETETKNRTPELESYRSQLEIKNESENLTELEKVLNLKNRLETLSPDSQSEISALIDDFAEKKAKVEDQILTENWYIENWTPADSTQLMKLLKSVPWSGETVELLIRAAELSSKINPKTPTRTGEELWIILQQMNRIQGKGIDRALSFFAIYEKLAATFLKFKAVKDRNDRALAAYEKTLHKEIEEKTKQLTEPENQESETE
jgi:hypothetical protein